MDTAAMQVVPPSPAPEKKPARPAKQPVAAHIAAAQQLTRLQAEERSEAT